MMKYEMFILKEITVHQTFINFKTKGIPIKTIISGD